MQQTRGEIGTEQRRSGEEDDAEQRGQNRAAALKWSSVGFVALRSASCIQTIRWDEIQNTQVAGGQLDSRRCF